MSPALTFNYMYKNITKTKSLIFIVLVITILINYCIYKKHLHELNISLSKSAVIISDDLTEILDNTNQFLTYVGKQIAKGDTRDLNFIYDTIKDIQLSQHQLSSKTLSWSLIDWVDENNMQSVNQKQGIMSVAKNMSSRSYTQDCKINPWTLKFSMPVVGTPSDVLVIPAGIGLTNESGRFLGILTIGFDIKNLESQIRSKISSRVNFMLSQNDNVILINELNKTDEEVVFNQKDQKSKIAKLLHYPNAIAYHSDTEYYLVKSIPNYPYDIYVGYNRHILLYKLVQSFAYTVMFELVIILLCLYLVRKTYEETIRSNKMFNKARDTLISDINSRLLNKTSTIKEVSKVLVHQLNQSSKVKLDLDFQNSLISAIYEASVNFWSPIDDDKIYVDLNNIIMEVINIKLNAVKDKNLKIVTNLNYDIPKVLIDGLCIKLLLIGFISYTISGLTDDHTIEINSKIDSIIDKQYVSIIIVDNGFGMSTKSRERIDNTCGVKSDLDYFNPSLENLSQIAEMLSCNFSINPVVGQGTKIVLNIPLISPDKFKNKNDKSKADIIQLKPHIE